MILSKKRGDPLKILCKDNFYNGVRIALLSSIANLFNPDIA